MAFGFGIDVSDFNNRDSYDYTKQVSNSAKDRAQKFLDSYMETDIVGGSAVKSTAEAKRMELLGEANAYANQQQQNAQTVGALASFAGNVGSFGAAGGFDPSKSFMNGSIFGSTPIGAGGGTLPKFGVFGKETVGTLGPNYGIPQ
tara:strand:- start:178 stop:612 length:435 start_codon:yes stop_codon:yes gene_type:complete